MEDAEKIQKNHYNKIAKKYEEHYSDEWSLKYRDKFFNKYLAEKINLKNLDILEAMCGSGQTASFLLSKGAKVTGLDISSELIKSFKKKYPTCEAICSSILDTKLPASRFDGVVVVSGLHHLHPNIEKAIEEIYRILKPDGFFYFVEPHVGSLPNLFRKIWYKFDKIFEKNEAAVDFEKLEKVFSNKFDLVKKRYQGNLAYLLVLNSLVFHIPLGLKRFISPPLFLMETVINKLQGKLLSCFGVALWKKK